MPQLPPADHIFWAYLRMTIIGVSMLGFSAFAFHNKMTTTDIVMILTTVGGVLGVDFFQMKKASSDKKNDSDSQ